MAKLDKSGLLKKINSLNSLHNSSVKFGIFGNKAKEKHNNSNLSVGQIARIHEEGRSFKLKSNVAITNTSGEIRWLFRGTKITIPSRAFFFSGTMNIKGSLLDVMRTQFKLLWVGSNNADNFLKQIGKFCKSEVQDAIKTFNGVPLNEYITVFKKGHNIPLIETEQLYNAIDFEVKKDMRMKANKK